MVHGGAEVHARAAKLKKMLLNEHGINAVVVQCTSQGVALEHALESCDVRAEGGEARAWSWRCCFGGGG
jgi:hypothetical protein